MLNLVREMNERVLRDVECVHCDTPVRATRRGTVVFVTCDRRAVPRCAGWVFRMRAMRTTLAARSAVRYSVKDGDWSAPKPKKKKKEKR